ncbi:MAG: dTDP-4-dehydrorhamnose 3,5-epimerase family protein [Endomicrobiales bacterium]|nr:dTDP-4-dehydrorhamnose 3,5-epimerase family protein [Endomicrobiales bacterium]
MKIINVKSLKFPEIKVITFARFCDQRGYFTETYRKSDFESFKDIDSLKNVSFLQFNESFSKKNTIRGLHFQWNPYMGKLVRTLSGKMVDLVLDIRKKSPTFGKIIAYEMPSTSESDSAEWIWVPPGFAHGNFFSESTSIEYCCSGEYSPKCEAGISPLAKDIDWSLCEPKLKKQFDGLIKNNPLITDKDKNGYSLESWLKSSDSDNFIHKKD